MSTSDAVYLVKQYIDELKRAEIQVSQAYLFGSYAKGRSTDSSDLDVCVVSPQFGRDRIEENVLLMKYRYGISDLIEPHAFSDDDFNDPYNNVAVQVKKTGVQVA